MSGKKFHLCENSDTTSTTARKILPQHEMSKILKKEQWCVQYNGTKKQRLSGRRFPTLLTSLQQFLKHDLNELVPKYSAAAGALKGFCSETVFLADDFTKNASTVFKRYLEVYQEYLDRLLQSWLQASDHVLTRCVCRSRGIKPSSSGGSGKQHIRHGL